MTTESDRLESVALAVAKAVPDFDEEQQRIALSVYRQLAEGSPAPAAAVAARANVPVERVEELLRSWPGVFLDGDQRVVGFCGLTIHELSPTHRLNLNGRQLFAWCAWDTLLLPGILGASLDVRSVSPTTGETISLVVAPRERSRPRVPMRSFPSCFPIETSMPTSSRASAISFTSSPPPKRAKPGPRNTRERSCSRLRMPLTLGAG